MTAFKLKVGKQKGEHVEITVFAGRDADHLAHCGKLTFRGSEADDMVSLMEGGETWLNLEYGDAPTVAVERDFVKLAGGQAPQHEPEWD
jgi:hypothetical protein